MKEKSSVICNPLVAGTIEINTQDLSPDQQHAFKAAQVIVTQFLSITADATTPTQVKPIFSLEDFLGN